VKTQWSRLILIFAAVALSVAFLWPTYQDYSFRQHMQKLSGPDSLTYVEQHQDDIANAKLKRIKLGLDLQGGMRVVLEVDVVQLLEDLAKNKDDKFKSIMAEVRKEVVSNDIAVIPQFAQKFQADSIRLSRYYGSIRDDDAKIVAELESETEKAVDRAVEIVRNRVDQYHVSEPNIQKQGSRRIIVELPGVKDENEVRQLLQGTAKLEFLLLKDPQIALHVMESIDKYLTGKTDTTGGTPEKNALAEKQQPVDALTQLMGNNVPAEEDTTQTAKFQREHPFFTYVRADQSGEGYVEEKNKERVTKLLEREDIQRLIPADFQFLWSAKTLTTAEGTKFYQLYALRSQAELNGGVIVDARASVDPEDNRPIVTMEMNSEGSHEWARITGANVQKRIAIALDNAVFSAPRVENKIVGGHSRITGLESPNEARLLEIVLKAGALPAPVAIIEQRAVGPSLGEDSIRSGMTAVAVALLFTIFFMAIYYRSAGGVADIALFFNMLFLLGVLAGFQATLTLPGISGIILTIGMAVDANVLIDERIREELAGGKTLRAAIDAGYSKAMSAIIDSNFITFITGVILYQYGTGPVQGFALTLMVGLATSLFSAIVITRVIFDQMIQRDLTPNFG